MSHDRQKRKERLLAMLVPVSTATLLLFSIGCVDGPPTEQGLIGEWTIRMSPNSEKGNRVTPASRSVEGAVVFDRRLPPYESAMDSLPGRTVLGRIYADFTELLHSGGERRQKFNPEPGGDMFEEVFANVDSTGSVVFEVAPQITGFDPVFHGTISRDSVVGSWMILAHMDTLRRGTFVMRRVSRSDASDSAFVRSRRAIRETGEPMPTSEGEVVDTLRSVTTQ